MHKTDVPVMAAQLNALCDVYEKKPISVKASEVWFDTLREFPVERVMDVLNRWAKTHNKFPTPSEVWKATNELFIEDRAKKAEAEKREFHPGVGGVQAEAFLAQMREILKRPKWTPREHWKRVLENPKATQIGKEYAKEVLMKMGALSKEREPGQDDEELRDAA